MTTDYVIERVVFEFDVSTETDGRTVHDVLSFYAAARLGTAIEQGLQGTEGSIDRLEIDLGEMHISEIEQFTERQLIGALQRLSAPTEESVLTAREATDPDDWPSLD